MTARFHVAQLGARRHYAVPEILHSAGLLHTLYTDAYADKLPFRALKWMPTRWQPAGLRRLLGRRARIPSEKVVAFQKFGWEYTKRLLQAQCASDATRTHLWAGDRFDALVLRHGLNEAHAVYGFNSACRKLFQVGKERGLVTIVDQTIAPRLAERRILESEIADAADWGSHEPDGNAAEYARRERDEWALADLIVCGSEFVREQVASEGGPVEKCVVVPYGVELAGFAAGERAPRRAGTPLQVLFVGSVGLRKGIRHLLDAMRRLEAAPVRCRVVGGWSVDPDVLCRHRPSNVELVGPVPRSEIASECARADVFCLPSLCEGSATVVYEALAAGLPVITTANAGSLVRDGVEGFIVPVRDPDAIAEKIDLLASDRALLAEMSAAALKRSAYGSLEAYGRRLVCALSKVTPRL